MSDEHKDSCATLLAQDTYHRHLKAWDEKVSTYKAKWPHHCQECDGWGGATSYYDPSPAGISLAPGYMVDFDPCQECLEKNICPRCGEHSEMMVESAAGYYDEFKCSKCGWSEEAEGIPMEPPEPDFCDCWSLNDLKEEVPW